MSHRSLTAQLTPFPLHSLIDDRSWAMAEGRGSLMYIELRTSPPPPDLANDSDSDPDPIRYFREESHDDEGPFTVSRRCDTHTGVVQATSAYELHRWE
jgi:hypothetical protein